MKTNRGSIFLETVIYINISIVILFLIYSIVYLSLEVYRKNMAMCEMKEISEVVEDRIRYEIKNSMGIDSIKTLSLETSDQEYTKNGYSKVSKILYTSNKIDDIKNDNVLNWGERKNISIKRNNIYVGRLGEYQIGNYVKNLYVKEKNINKKTVICFIIVYKIEKYKYVSSFYVYI